MRLTSMGNPMLTERRLTSRLSLQYNTIQYNKIYLKSHHLQTNNTSQRLLGDDDMMAINGSLRCMIMYSDLWDDNDNGHKHHTQ